MERPICPIRRDAGAREGLGHVPATLVAWLLLLPAAVAAQWSAQPGERVRDAFGPPGGAGATVCRGACGAGCPSTCEQRVAHECVDGERLRRVRIYECGSHLGCREHDDCLDRCSQQHAQGFDCQTQCHGEAVERFGFELATSWAAGRGPYDGAPITFEYTRDSPGDPEPAFRCPDGASLECAGGSGRCLAAGGAQVAPVFDSYPSAGPAAMRISGFRSGPLCGDRVCEQTADILVSGRDSCQGGDGTASCTRYGMEFDYRDADPSMPLDCSTSTSDSDGDFVGNLLKRGLEFMPAQDAGADQAEGNGMGQLLGLLQKVVAAADSPEDVDISMAPLGPDGEPIEAQRVGTGQVRPRPVPNHVDLPGPSGHLVVPMYQTADSASSEPVMVREVRCSHKGVPVLETTFRLRFDDR